MDVGPSVVRRRRSDRLGEAASTDRQVPAAAAGPPTHPTSPCCWGSSPLWLNRQSECPPSTWSYFSHLAPTLDPGPASYQQHRSSRRPHSADSASHSRKRESPQPLSAPPSAAVSRQRPPRGKPRRDWIDGPEGDWSSGKNRPPMGPPTLVVCYPLARRVNPQPVSAREPQAGRRGHRHHRPCLEPPAAGNLSRRRRTLTPASSIWGVGS